MSGYLKVFKPYYFCYLLIVLCGLIGLMGCSEDKKTAKPSTTQSLEAKQQILVTPLYFSGIINPLKTTPINAAFDGIINKQFFSYGQFVKKGDLLFIIESEQMEKEFLSAVSDYMKAVDNYTNANRKYIGSEELWKLQFISANEYYSDKHARDEAYFSMRQSAISVKRMLEKSGIDFAQMDNIDLTDRNVMDHILAKKQDKIKIAATLSGLALSPNPASNNNENATGETTLGQGSEVKQGQVLVTLGDMSGLTVNIDVNEVDISRIKKNQKAKITSAAFAGITLTGFVSDIDVQAQSNTASLPTFEVTIIIPKLTPEQRSVIFVGMSAKVEILLEEKNVILLPINAVFQVDGQSMVKIKNKKTGDIQSVAVIPGKTTLDKIAIVSGIQPGDTIVYSD